MLDSDLVTITPGSTSKVFAVKNDHTETRDSKLNKICVTLSRCL